MPILAYDAARPGRGLRQARRQAQAGLPRLCSARRYWSLSPSCHRARRQARVGPLARSTLLSLFGPPAMCPPKRHSVRASNRRRSSPPNRASPSPLPPARKPARQPSAPISPMRRRRQTARRSQRRPTRSIPSGNRRGPTRLRPRQHRSGRARSIIRGRRHSVREVLQAKPTLAGRRAPSASCYPWFRSSIRRWHPTAGSPRHPTAGSPRRKPGPHGGAPASETYSFLDEVHNGGTITTPSSYARQTRLV